MTLAECKLPHLINAEIPIWLVSQWPYLVHHHPIAPHITLCGVLPVQNGLRSRPLDRNRTSFGFVVVVFVHVMGHAKVSNLLEWIKARGVQDEVRCTCTHTVVKAEISNEDTSFACLSKQAMSLLKNSMQNFVRPSQALNSVNYNLYFWLSHVQVKQCIELRSDFASVLRMYLNHQLSMPNNFHETDF